MDSDSLKTLFDEIHTLFTPSQHDSLEGPVLVTRPEYKVHDLNALLEKHKPQPDRAKGITRHDTLASLIEHAHQYKINTTVAYCSLTAAPALTVIFNDHGKFDGCIDPGWRDLRAVYQFPFSDAWKRWNDAANKALTVQQFAELLEEGIADIRDPASVPDAPVLEGVVYATPSSLLTLAQGLAVRIDQQVAEYRRLSDGASIMGFSEKHETSVDGKPVTVPGGFLLGVQPFVGGKAYPVPVRLRYRVKDRQVAWTLVLHDAAGVRRDAIIEAAERFKTEASLPLFYGSPDA